MSWWVITAGWALSYVDVTAGLLTYPHALGQNQASGGSLPILSSLRSGGSDEFILDPGPGHKGHDHPVG